MKKAIQINSSIFPNIMTITLEKAINLKDTNKEQKDVMIGEPDLVIDLPKSVHLIYLQKIVSEHCEMESRFLKQYACGEKFCDEDYSKLFNIILKPIKRSWLQDTSKMDILSQFGIYLSQDVNGKKQISIIEDAIPTIQVETWECIIIDMLKKSALDIINCFDFDKNFERKGINTPELRKLSFSLNAWKFTSDNAEQRLSNALRSAFMYTLVSYNYGDLKEQYGSFEDFFDNEFYKRVSLIYGIWSSRKNDEDIKYIPIYESFYNLDGFTKEYLTRIMCSILDNNDIALDEKLILKNRLIQGAGEFHLNTTEQSKDMENDLVKPVINYVILREKAKETLTTSQLLYDKGKYSDCADRCYYAMMYALKSLLEKKEKLSAWKTNELKESETHNSLEDGLDELISDGVLDSEDKSSFDFVKDKRWKCNYSLFVFLKNDAQTCLDKARGFINKIEHL